MITLAFAYALIMLWIWICRMVRRGRMYIGYAALWMPMMLFTLAVVAGAELWLVMLPAGGIAAIAGFLVALFTGLIYITSALSVLAESLRKIARSIALDQLPAGGRTGSPPGETSRT